MIVPETYRCKNAESENSTCRSNSTHGKSTNWEQDFKACVREDPFTGRAFSLVNTFLCELDYGVMINAKDVS